MIVAHHLMECYAVIRRNEEGMHRYRKISKKQLENVCDSIK